MTLAKENARWMYGLPEKIIQRNMLKADLVSYYSQLHSFPWTAVARRTCGITAATMGLSLARPDVDPMDVLEMASKLHEVPRSRKNLWLEVTYEGKSLRIPAGQDLDTKLLGHIRDEKLTLSDTAQNKSETYNPVFSLANGYDHRGSKRLFEAFGVRAEMMGSKQEPLSMEKLKEVIKSGAVFMASVTNSITPWLDFSGAGPATHVILITDLVHIMGQDWYYIVDPYSPTSKKAVFLQPADGFQDIEFNGFGTAIYPDLKK